MDGVPRILIAGGGYAGVAALAELRDMALDASARCPGLSHRAMRRVLVEAADRILPEVGTAMADHAAALLRRRNKQPPRLAGPPQLALAEAADDGPAAARCLRLDPGAAV